MSVCCERILSQRTGANTEEGEALHDGTGSEVTSSAGNDNLTRWHICNYLYDYHYLLHELAFLSRPSRHFFL